MADLQDITPPSAFAAVNTASGRAPAGQKTEPEKIRTTMQEEGGIHEMPATVSAFDKIRRSSVATYYPELRFFGALFAALFSPASKAIGNYFSDHKEILPYVPSGKKAFPEYNQWLKPFVTEKPTTILGRIADKFKRPSQLRSCLADHPEAKNWNVTQIKNELGTMPDATGEDTDRLRGRIPAEYAAAKDHHYHDIGKRLFSRFEAVVFLTISTIHFIKDSRSLKNNMAAAVGAELGKDPEQVGLWDMFKSRNHLVHASMNRFRLQTVVRYATDALFWVGLKSGLVAEAVRTNLERSLFAFDRLPYDYLVAMIAEVQDGILTSDPRGRLVNGFINTMQRFSKENGLRVMSREEVEMMRPAFEHLAEGVLQKRAGVNEVIYLLGLGFDERNLERTMNNIDIVLQHGLGGVARAKNTGETLTITREIPIEDGTVMAGQWAEKNPQRKVQPAQPHTTQQLILAGGVGSGRGM